MLDLPITLQSTEKSYTFPLKDTPFKSSLSNSSDILPRQNQGGRLLFLLLALIL